MHRRVTYTIFSITVSMTLAQSAGASDDSPAVEAVNKFNTMMEELDFSGKDCAGAVSQLEEGVAMVLDVLREDSTSPREHDGVHWTLCDGVRRVGEVCKCSELSEIYTSIESSLNGCQDRVSAEGALMCIPPPAVVTNDEISPATPESVALPELEPTQPVNNRLMPVETGDLGPSSKSPLKITAITTGVLGLSAFAGAATLGALTQPRDPEGCTQRYGSYCSVYKAAVAQGVPTSMDDSLCGSDATGDYRRACSQWTSTRRGYYAALTIGSALGVASITTAILHAFNKKKRKSQLKGVAFGPGTNRSFFLSTILQF